MKLFKLEITISKDGKEIKKKIRDGFESRGSANFYGTGWVDCYFEENGIAQDDETYGYVFGATEYEEEETK